MKIQVYVLTIMLGLIACKKKSTNIDNINHNPYTPPTDSAIQAVFQGSIDINNLYEYANQNIPAYILKDNAGSNFITNKGATLGRVLFYDKNLSTNNNISCASCHQQSFAFSDTAIQSIGVNGLTARHSMRLINTRFSDEVNFFWNERATSLEMQTTMPIQDHNEMGYSGQQGDLSMQDLISKLNNITYYKELFTFVYGSPEINETKIQLALAQFIRSIQSFDSKYDIGRAQVLHDSIDFPNFTTQENNGKTFFISKPIFDANSERIGGGLGCGACHRAPEFDIDPTSKSNGLGASIAGGPDMTNTRAPSIRDLIQQNGTLNGPMMHTAIIKSLQAAIGHYGNLTAAANNNTNLDMRLKPNGTLGQQLHLTAQEVNSVIAFLKTLSGNNVYTDPKWSNPFPH